MSRKKYVDNEKKIAVGDRLRFYLDSKNKNYGEISTIIGISGGFLSDVLSGRSSLSQENLISLLLNFTDLNPEWLLTGEGEMLKTIICKAAEQQTPYIYSENPEIKELLDDARYVLTSGNALAFNALERNIKYFRHAVSVESEIKELRQENVDIKDRCSEIENQLKALKRDCDPVGLLLKNG